MKDFLTFLPEANALAVLIIAYNTKPLVALTLSAPTSQNGQILLNNSLISFLSDSNSCASRISVVILISQINNQVAVDFQILEIRLLSHANIIFNISRFSKLLSSKKHTP